ncbi:MAG TPA: DUF2007 domain-containing protein [Patescibacteria group bacterium]
MKLVYSGSQPEAKMMQEILTNAEIKSILELSPSGLHGLRTEIAGGSLPGETWELLVRDEDEEKAKELLPI